MDDRFWFSAVFVGGITAILYIMLGLDWLARRKDKRTRDRAA
jgi:hypothetical protein